MNIQKDDIVYKAFAQSNAIMHGCFELSSGLISDTYMQCALLFTENKTGEYISRLCVEKLPKKIIDEVEIIVGPAIGAMIFCYEFSRQINLIRESEGDFIPVKNFFCEKVINANGEKSFTLKRGFKIKPNQKVLIVEDVCTTGNSALKCANVIKNDFNAEIIAAMSIIDRSCGKAKNLFQKENNIPYFALRTWDIMSYDRDNLPNHLAELNAVYLGSQTKA
ncbi:MAG: phosphoribosyltransferase family protein [Anaplasmataceae bacterium]|nr:phosphoribosyltransferase family protein [Candidatus Heimdallarchaeota archaeon]MDH5796602.1 phosphoribosyltransferase family protein [Anaplasmataceae bacterium]